MQLSHRVHRSCGRSLTFKYNSLLCVRGLISGKEASSKLSDRTTKISKGLEHLTYEESERDDNNIQLGE